MKGKGREATRNALTLVPQKPSPQPAFIINKGFFY
jgi:hypothetical protein